MNNCDKVFYNPNDVIRKHITSLYSEALKNSAMSVDTIENLFKKYMNIVKEKDNSLYEMMVEIMYTDYVIGNVLMHENEKTNTSELVSSKEELLSLVSKDRYILADMASSTRNREIDLSHIYTSMYKIDVVEKEGLLNVSKLIIYDYIEYHYPFVIDRIHDNLKDNAFTKESTTKSISIIELLNEIKSYEEEDYKRLLNYYLEIYYKFKKYGIKFLDVVITHKERILLKLLDEGNINGAITLVSRDDDLLELVLNEYSNHYFDMNVEYRNEVENYYLSLKRREKLDSIFRKKEKNNE